MTEMTGVADGETIVSLLLRRSQELPDAPFLTFEGCGTRTYAQFQQDVTALAGGLASIGVGPGQTVAMLLDNTLDSARMWFATNAAAGIDAQLNTAYKQDFLAHQVNDSAAEVLVVEAGYLSRIAEIEDELAVVKTVVCRGAVPDIAFARLAVVPLDALREGPPPQALPLSTDLSTLVYTAGTTGPSKGCMISHSYVLSMAQQTVRATRLARTDVTWTPLPMFHMNAKAGTVAGALIVGGHAAFVRRFSLSRFWEQVAAVNATRAKMLGSMLSLVAGSSDGPPPDGAGALKYVIGSPVTPEVARAYADRWGVRAVAPGYGLTEAAMVVTVEGLGNGPAGSSGRANAEFDVRIVDDYDREVPAGQRGEIVVRPNKPGVMFSGYWRRDADTVAMLRNLWLHTGDIGRVDENGWFYFIDRKKDYLRRRGENVSTYELETTFARHEAVSEVSVYGVPSALTEDEIKISVVLVDGADATPEQLCRWSVDKLPYFAVPRYVDIRHELPKNPFGRILKYRLRDEGITPQTWDREAADISFERR